ncbi:MAG: hypothetical protein ACYC9L_06215 [Sulfuricaulis sp.]
MIETIEEAIRNHMESAVAAACLKYKKAVHPIYRLDRNQRPTLFGTCFGLEVDGRKYVVTAAHKINLLVTAIRSAPAESKVVSSN